MKFRIFTFQEYIYKWLSYSIVIIFTFGSIGLYIYVSSNKNEASSKALLNSDELTLIISIGYALLLFIINIYMTNVSSKIQNLIFKRKEQYINLKELASFYKDRPDRNLSSFIDLSRILTGRAYKEIKPKIKQDGFVFTNKFNKLENLYKEHEINLSKNLNYKIKIFINTRNMKTKSYSFIYRLEEFLFDFDNWVQEKFESPSDQRQFKYYADRLFEENKKEISQFKRSRKQLIKVHSNINKRANTHVQKLEEIYGERLIELVNSEYNLLANLQVLEQLIKELEVKVLSYDDFLELSSDNNVTLEAYLKHIEHKLEMVSKNVEDILNE